MRPFGIPLTPPERVCIYELRHLEQLAKIWREKYEADKKDYEDRYWFLADPQPALARFGYIVEKKRAEEFAGMFEHILGNGGKVFRAVGELQLSCGESPELADQAINLYLNNIAPHVKDGMDLEVAIRRGGRGKMNRFLEARRSEKFDKGRSKEVFAEWFDSEDDETILAEICAKYPVADTGFVDQLIDEVLAENAEQAEKAKLEPKLVNWLVGQVMKKAKGKLSADTAKSVLMTKLGLA